MRVLFFAALREAAGTREVVADAPDLTSLLVDLLATLPREFARALPGCTAVVDGRRVKLSEHVDLTGAQEVALLPPFAGG